MPDLSVWTPLLWDNENNKDLVWLDETRHDFRRFTFQPTRFKDSRLPWVKIEDVRRAISS